MEQERGLGLDGVLTLESQGKVMRDLAERQGLEQDLEAKGVALVQEWLGGTRLPVERKHRLGVCPVQEFQV